MAARRALLTLESLEDRRLLAIDTLIPVEDAFVRDGNYRSSNFGQESALITKLDGTGYSRNSFLRFDLAPIHGTVTGATLFLHPTSSGTGGITNVLATVGDDAWDEEQITWQNQPAKGGTVTSWQVQSGQVVEVDVTALVQAALGDNGLLSFVVFSPQNYGPNGWVAYGSSEAGSSVQPKLEINSTGGNTAPVAEDDSYVVERNQPLTIPQADGLLANDSDLDGDALSASLLAAPANGSVTINTDGSFTYAPVAGFVGTDSFTYVANDGEVNSSPATVTIAVLPYIQDVGITPEADALVRDGSYSYQNFGLEPFLVTKNDASSYFRNSFLRFDLSGIQGILIGAKLRLHPTGVGQGDVVNVLAAVSNDTWGEEQITWENKPSMGAEVGSWVVHDGEVVEVDVTALVQEARSDNQLLSLAVFSRKKYGSEGWVVYGSREASSDIRPELVLTGAVRNAHTGDVDADSDNNSPTGEIEHSENEESLEDTAPGKVVAVSTAESKVYTPLDVKLNDFDPSTSKVMFTGNSNLFRVWNADPSIPGTPIQINFGKDYPVSTAPMIFASGTWRRFYVEALDAGTDEIIVSLDPLGSNQWTEMDHVTFTAAQIDVNTDSNNDGTINEADDADEDDQARVVVFADSDTAAPAKITVNLQAAGLDSSWKVRLELMDSTTVSLETSTGVLVVHGQTWSIADAPTELFARGLSEGETTVTMVIVNSLEDV